MISILKNKGVSVMMICFILQEERLKVRTF